MSVLLRTFRGRALTSRPIHLAVRPEPYRINSWRSASSFAGPEVSASRPSLLRRAATVFALGIFSTSLAFTMAVSPAVPTVTALMNPPTDEESLALYEPQTEEERRVEDFIKNHPVAQELRKRGGFTESRPHMKIPETYRGHHLTGGLLSGPGRIVVPPLVFLEGDGKSMVAISYLGNELCGHPGIVHGGLLATMLDDLAKNGAPAMMPALFPHSVAPGGDLGLPARRQEVLEGAVVEGLFLRHGGFVRAVFVAERGGICLLTYSVQRQQEDDEVMDVRIIDSRNSGAGKTEQRIES
ncbi:hypothetical protein NUW58_g10425 [Xylaria curta]|uniref:Uncharacterized protein n=1 Tax=Xylaria curta TaxID=42375 RepID=A0ACC1MKL7_9PEZI|nr:hypothetical protein NUW58_g10425 [Xylaria curta]